MNFSKPTPELNTILCKSSETYPYSNGLRSLSPLLNILDLVKHKKHYKNDDAIFENQLKRETKEWLHLQLNKKEKNLGIKPSNTAPKRFCQDRLTKCILST